MPTRPYRILSRNLYQRLGAEAAWDRAIEIIRKSERGQRAAQVLMRTLSNSLDRDSVELVRELDKQIESMIKDADIEIAVRKGRRRVPRSAGEERSHRETKSPGSPRTPK